MQVRRVLGIDPGLGSTGYGIVDFSAGRYRMVTYGVIDTKAGEPHGERLLSIYNRLAAVILEWRPTEAGMETLYFARNVSSALTVSEAKGVVTLCLAQNAIPLAEYAPNTIKKSVSGTTTADKKTVQEYVKLLLGLSEIPEPDHAADALAAAITHINQRITI
jgi:crossover junction endodeoxyribonuclease RuvC